MRAEPPTPTPVAGREAAVARADATAEQLFYQIMLDPMIEDPYPAYRRLREQAPALLTSDGTLVLTRYADCDAALRHRSLGKADELLEMRVTPLPEDQLEQVIGQMRRSMLFANPPDHTRLRRLVSAEFTTRHVQELRGAIRRRTDQYLERLAVRSGTDFMTTLALPLPVNVIADLLGVPESDRAAFAPRVRALAALLEPTADVAALAAATTAQTDLASYFTDLLDHKRAKPADDLLSRLAAARADDALTEDEMVSTALLLFGAGFETTTNLLGNGLNALLTHPDQLAALREDPGLIPGAVEELLRHDSPVQLDARTVLEPVTFTGVRLEPGQLVITLLGAANHDPDHFPRPDNLDVTRSDNAHLAFASGIHFCLGAHLTRLEAQVFLQRLVTGYTAINPTRPATRRPGLGLRGFARLPVTLHP